MTENITTADIDAYRRGSAELTDNGQGLAQQVRQFLGEVGDPSALGTRDTIGRYGNPMYRVAVGWVGRCLKELAGAYQDHGQALAGSADGYQRNEEINGSQASRRGHLEQRDLVGDHATGPGWESPAPGAVGAGRRIPESDLPVHRVSDPNDLTDWPGGRRPGGDVDGIGGAGERTPAPDLIDTDGRPGTSAAGLVPTGSGPSGSGAGSTGLGSTGASAAGLGATGSPSAGQPGVLNPHLGGADQAGVRPGGRPVGAEGGPGMMPPPAGGGRRDDRRSSDGSGRTDQHLAEDEDQETVWDALATGGIPEQRSNPHHRANTDQGETR